MATLTINCRFPGDGRLGRNDGEPLVLRMHDKCHSSSKDKLTVEHLDLVHRTGHRRFWVLRGVVTGPLDSVDSILKLDMTGASHCDDLLKEAEVYIGKARSLQGDYLPQFYGCFQAEVNLTTVTCLALEYCGEPVSQSLRDMNRGFKQELIYAVLALHAKGMTHGDLQHSNILVYPDGGEDHPVLIDFDLADTSHICAINFKIVSGAVGPEVEEYGCEEMHELIYWLGYWRLPTIGFGSTLFRKDEINDLDDLIDVLPSYLDDERRQELVEQAALLLEEILRERRLTYGTETISQGQRRLDYLEPKAA
ncbi:hypothetical protein FB45DRAFT_910555 [Roridomyces roridus]|uniref:Protein kinase domain-containing protein n=1 Tax=Roridomyces roridus TaxID=1738132 RepID=A0AAD7FSI1_9AGAR|nr:hypothetical protein FB45DRAFT_910555 [Roridomyces roridus]